MNVLRLAAFPALGLLCTAVVFAQETAKTTTAHKENSATDSQIERKLISEILALKAEIDQQERTLTATDDLLDHLLDGSTKPPIKVRGGAMTFHLKNKDVWTLVSGNKYCSSVTIGGFLTDGYTLDSSLPTSKYTDNEWTMYFYVHDTAGNTSKNGALLTYYADTDCGGHTGHRVTLEPIVADTAQNDFYDDTPPLKRRRFRQKACHGLKGDGTPYDTDLCETVSEVDLHFIKPPTDGIKQDITLTCSDGDCTLSLLPQTN